VQMPSTAPKAKLFLCNCAVVSVKVPRCQKLQMTAKPSLAQDAYDNSGCQRVNSADVAVCFVCVGLAELVKCVSLYLPCDTLDTVNSSSRQQHS